MAPTVATRTRVIAAARVAVIAAAAALLDSNTKKTDVEVDFRTVLASSGISIFSARLSGVPWQPKGAGPTLDSPIGNRLTSNARHWLLLGKEYEQQDGISLRSLFPEAADLNQLRTVLDAYERHARDRKRWGNIAIANAVSGNLETAASMLERGGAFADFHTRSDRAAMQSDAAAIRIQQFEMTGDPRFALRALIAADWAINKDSRLPEAHFNRALALEKIGLGTAAVVSYERALQYDRSPDWVDETSARIQRLSEPTRTQLWLRTRSRLQRISGLDAAFVAHTVRTLPRQARTAAEDEYLGRWALAVESGDTISANHYLDLARLIGNSLKNFSGESLLADAVLVIDKSNKARQAVARGHRLYMTAKSRSGSAAARMFEEAAKQFDLIGSPMSSLARYYAARHARSIGESYSAMLAIEPHIKRNYLALRALVDADLGQDLAERGDVYAAFQAYTRAEQSFECLGEIEGTARMRSARAHMLTFMGNPLEAWRIRTSGLAAADRSGDSALIEEVVREAALDEMFERDDSTALAIYGTIVHPSMLYPARRIRFAAWRSPVKFSEVQTLLASLDSHPLRADVENELDFARATSLWRTEPREADRLLSKCIDYSRVTGRALMLPYLLLYRAKARELMNDDAAAIADLRRSLSLLEGRCEKIGPRDLRDVCTVTADDVFFALSDLYWRRGADDRVFAIGEERRGFVFMHNGDESRSMQPLSIADIAKRLQPDMALVVFTSSQQYTMASLIEHDRVAMHRVGDLTGMLLRKKRQIVDAIRRDRQEALARLSRELYDELIAPLGLQPGRTPRLVIVADQPLKDFPFTLLRDRRSRQYLAERFELLHAPNASVFVQKERLGVPNRTARIAVTIGDPAFDQQLYPDLSPLPAARDQSKRVADQYSRAPALTGQDATFRNLADRIRFADVVDIATHTAPDAKEPSLFDLIFARDGEDGSACSVQQIAGLPLKKGSTVMVAGCQTAVSRDWGDLRDFAGAFLAAGAESAVATLWDVEDETTRDFTLRFHEALRHGNGSAAAVRSAQLSMLHSRNPNLRDVRAWAGFQVYTLGR